MYPSVKEGMITTRIATTLALGLFGVLVISAAIAPEAYAQQGGSAQNSNSQTSNNPLGSIVPGLQQHSPFTKLTPLYPNG